jgi:endonuclease/exonuclease/phosphatase (EEP) superfamily protein YafD
MIVRIVLWAGLLAGAAMTLGGMLAPFHPPADFLNHFRPYAFAGACALLLATLAVRAARLVWASTILVGLNAVLLGLPLLWSAQPAERPTLGQALASSGGREIKLVTFNMQFGDAAAVARLLLQEDADIVLLQEVGATQGKALRALLRERYPHARVCVVARICAAAIFAKRPWVEAGQEYGTKDTPEAVWVRFDDPEIGKLRVVSVHLSLPFRHEQQTHQIERLIALRRDFSEPAIIAGDFNMTPWAYRLKRLLSSAGLRRHATFLRSWPTDGQFRVPMPAFLIDHVITTPDIARVSIRTGPRTGSDHLPVVARVRLPLS